MANVKTAKRTADYVTVACKLPNGLIIPLEGRAQPVRLHGTHSPYARFGFGMTEVEAAVWDQILKQYGDRMGTNRDGDKAVKTPKAAWLANGIVFAHSDTRSTNSEAKEKEGLRVGFEPIDPKNLDATPGVSSAIQREGASDPGELTMA
jgi:hypothetical protein